ncbi:MAG: ABC transporter substrate-binding protein [Spirochaetaceae bacterium]|jgi:ribose transport system substrate-binding protein|nr:ABC transporter substrate-binding protein [Spirochaetaceae bacterium]
MKKIVLMALCLMVVLSGAVFARGGSQSGGDGKMYIAMISKGFQQQFWQYVKQGADQAAAEFGVTITFEGPESESMIDKQMEMFQTALGKNPAAICFGALDAQADAPLVAEAKRRGIPVVTFDATVASDDPVSFVATDSRVAAAAAADKMGEALGGQGKVAIICHDQTNTTGILRRDGFVDRIKEKYPNIQLLEVQYGGGDPLRSTEIVKTVINANSDLKGYYATNEGSAIGLANAITELNLKGKIVGIGFDSGRVQLDAIRSGTLYGAIQQNPVLIGYKAVEMAYRAVNGETVPKIIDSGYVWADQGNIDSKEVQAVVYQ